MYNLILRAHNPFGQHQGSRPLDRPNFLSMHRIPVLVSYIQLIRFVRFGNDAMNRRYAVLELARGLDPW